MNHNYHSRGLFYGVENLWCFISRSGRRGGPGVGHDAPEYKTGAEWVIALLFVALAVFLFWQGAKSSAGKKAKRQGGNGTYMTEQDLQQIQGGVLPVLSSVPVVLEEGEVAHFFAPARRYITKKKAVGRTGSGGGVSVRVAKGVSVRSGGGASQTVYDDVTDAFDGLAVLTNRRIVFLAKQNGFDCKLSAISAILPEGDGLMIQPGRRTIALPCRNRVISRRPLIWWSDKEKRRTGFPVRLSHFFILLLISCLIFLDTLACWESFVFFTRAAW